MSHCNKKYVTCSVVGEGNDHDRPESLPISPCRRSRHAATAPDDSQHETDCGFENLPLSDLMSEYARQDKHYDGVVESESTASSKDQNGSNLLPTTTNNGTNKVFMALKIDKKGLSLASNGNDQPHNNDQRCQYVYHHSGSPSPGISILSLNPAQSPHLSPIYHPDIYTYGEVITFSESTEITPSPGTLAVKLESKMHVYLALDYTDESHPKLIGIEENVLEKMLMQEVNQGGGGGGGESKIADGGGKKNIKPIINVRKYPGTEALNNTAFYFKTEKNYHFVTVNQKTLHLEVKSISVSHKTKDSYIQYLSFGPEPLDSCPTSSSKKTATGTAAGPDSGNHDSGVEDGSL